ncbi:BatD family protein [Agrilutibacter solisilvae]|uniref:BatD family protein n=1 Tax=Agrilutibacter solisilvae TaxID=2763317 RepID=A0A974XZH0_9GAMM|nr:BatD family protein [Lysobacter solisilvae]QSX78632.1 BatD family protein [Lysobacter solisilvae]
MPSFRARPVVAALLALLVMALLPVSAQAQRAWLDRDQIRLGETVTLNIQSDDGGAPDYAPLARDFDLSGYSSRARLESVNGRMRQQTLFAVALRPRRAGNVVVPALRVGGSGRTSELALSVQSASAGMAGTITDTIVDTIAQATGDDDVFIRGEPDDRDPYVQQAVGWVVRLYSAAPLISGQLTQASPDGASLQQVGEDARYSRVINGRRYEVVERRYQLIPERSGEIVIPGATFEGRGTGGLFDDLFGGRGASLSAQAPATRLRVLPAPANAPQPWLPLRNLRLRYAGTPQDLRVGSAGALTIEVVADGASAAQMPELQLPPIEGVQVFAEPVQADETFRDGRPQVKLLRRFSLVPSRSGSITLSGLTMPWWDVVAGARRQATLPPMSWQVAASAGAPAAATPAPGRAARALDSLRGEGASPGAADSIGGNRGWILATLLFAALWLFTLVWGLHRRAAAHAPAAARTDRAPLPAASGTATADLRQALDTGDLGDVAQALCAMASPPARDVDDVRARLADASQRDAVDALQRARWGDGDGVGARRLLREAFARGPRWHAPVVNAPSLLPPLYPTG